MVKNVLIALLLITNGGTLYYIYAHMQPSEQRVIVDTQAREQQPQYFYRITMTDGGVAEGSGIMQKAESIDLMDRGRMVMTISNRNIFQVEKVSYRTGTSTVVITRSTLSRPKN